MYPFERYMKVFKGWVRSRRHPEGCIAESYVVEEAVEFCAEGLLNDASTTVYGKEMEQAHLCMLQNKEDAKSYFKFAKDEKWLKDKQNQTFSAWLKERVSNELQNPGNTILEIIRWMSVGPTNVVATFSGYKVNGVEFYTKQRDNMRLVQNSGVSLVVDVMAGSSTSSLNARALALRMKTKEFLRKRARSEVSNEEASIAKAATPRRSPRSTRANEVAQTSKDAPNKVVVVQPRRSPHSTKVKVVAQSSKDAPNNVVDSDDEDEELDDDEDEEESDENVTGGLRLLRRGMVTMSWVNRRLVRGRKLRVKYNDDREPVGRAAKEMQSYIGVLASTKVPINVKDWRIVALSVKDNIWGSVEEAYVVPKKWKKMVLASAGQKWREFKSKLTTWYIIPYLDSPELFEFSPDDYRMIDENQWKEFVKDRISPQFQEFQQKQKERRKENKYPHQLGRKPYAQLQEELAATMPGRKLGRTTMWKVARQDKDGNYKAPEVQKKVNEIDKLEKEVLEGKRKFEGLVDVLTTTLGTLEYSGKVRGLGVFIKPEAYFHLPKRAKLYSDDSARQRSGQGSCSRLAKAGVGCNEVEGVKAIKKKLDLEEGKLQKQVEADEVIPKVQNNEKPLIVEEEVHVQSSPTVHRHNLVIGSLDNIVAEGTIVIGVDSISQTIHGVPLAAENIRVSVTKCLVENALLPVPARDDILFVCDTIGTCVAWPKD
ncbi:hypothetical protein ACLB2K_063466 [Fragaria x ananassa]